VTVTISPPMFLQFFNPNNSGAPAAGYLLFTYIAGTSTKQATWTDSTQTVQNANPLVLDSSGGGYVWGDPTLAYKFVWAPANDTDPPTSPIRTVDNLYFPIDIGVLTQQLVGSIIYPQTAAELAASVTPVNYQYGPGSVDRYGINTTPGTTDMSAAVRSALDAVPANGGMIYFLPTAKYFIGSVVYIPQRMNAAGQRGTIIEGNNCTLIGNGLGSGATAPGSGLFTTLASGSISSAIFESGTGQFSTVAKGGATNFGLGNEQSTTLHYNDKIRNINFVSFGLALHLFNFTAGCELSNLWFEQGYTAVFDDRCFYSRWQNINAFFQQSGVGHANFAIFNLTDTINDRVFEACHAVGACNTTPAATDIGWQVGNGVQGCAWLGCSAEQCAIGFTNLGQINGATWTGGYFESNAQVAMSLGSSNVTMEIEGNDFIGSGQPNAIIAQAWTQGRLGRSNNYDNQTPISVTFTAPPSGTSGTLTSGFSGATDPWLITFSDGQTHVAAFTNGSTAVTWATAVSGSPTTAATVTNNTVTLSAAANTCTVELPPQFFSESQSTATTAQVPGAFQLAGSVQIEGRRIVYASAVGLNAEMIAEDLTNTGPPRFAYSGGPVDEGFQTGSWLPFCTQTNTSGQSTFLTQINFSSNRMVVLFDLFGTITAGGSGNVQLSGIIFAGGASTLRSDANTTYTVTPSSSGGKLLLTVAGSGFTGKTISWEGQIRHV
jgi:hypothetical protein